MNDRLFIVENCTIETFQLHLTRAKEKSSDSYIHPETYCYAWISFHKQAHLWKCNELREYLGQFTLTSAWNNAIKHI